MTQLGAHTRTMMLPLVHSQQILHLTHRTKSFEGLSSKFEVLNHLRIAKTTHGINVEMFHIMIDLSEETT